MSAVSTIRSALLAVTRYSNLRDHDIAEHLAKMGELEWIALADSCEAPLPTLAERAELVRSFREE